MEENLVDSKEVAGSDDKSGDKVSYESFRKSVEAEKRARQRAQELEAQLESIRTQKLEEEKEYKTLADEFKAKFQQTQEELKNERERYQWQTVTSSIKLKAREEGCIDPDKLIKLFDKTDFELLRAENGQIKSESLATLMDKAKKENSFLFNKGKVNINDATPGAGQPDKVDLSKMTVKELEELAIKNFGKK